MTEEDIVHQLEANTAALKELQLTTQKTAKYLKWLRIMEIIKWVLIIVPLILTILYLPMLMQGLSSSYGELLPNASNLNSLLK